MAVLEGITDRVQAKGERAKQGAKQRRDEDDDEKTTMQAALVVLVIALIAALGAASAPASCRQGLSARLPAPSFREL
jgi:hypothetical protein